MRLRSLVLAVPAALALAAPAAAQAPAGPPTLDGVTLDERCPVTPVRGGLGTLRFTTDRPVTLELRLALRQPSQRRRSCPVGQVLPRSPEVPYTTVAEAQTAVGGGPSSVSLRSTGGAVAPRPSGSARRSTMRTARGRATIRQAGPAAVSLVQLTGGRPLERGTYVLFVTAKDAAAQISPTRLVKLWVLPRPQQSTSTP